MNRKSSLPVALLLGASVLILPTLTPADEPQSAETLYENNCLKCHDSDVFTRPDHKITSLPGLKRQVQRCELGLGLQWFDDDIDKVASYLNKNYYHFSN